MIAAMRRFGLRTRLAFAFLASSVPPVLVGSAIAVAAISQVFHSYIDVWLEETARYLANDLRDSQAEAQRVVNALAERWDDASTGMAADPQARLQTLFELLRSVGYDGIVLYRGETPLARAGNVEFPWTLPERPGAFVRFATQAGRSALLVGAATRVGDGADAPMLLIADAVNDRFASLHEGILSLDLRIFERVGDGFVEAVRLNATEAAQQVEPAAARALAGGERSRMVRRSGEDGSVAYASLQGPDGSVIGLISCELAHPVKLFLDSWEVRLFAALTVVAAALSVLIGVAVARRLARPVRALTVGMRAIRDGDYAHRVPEEGGPEFEELGRGYNDLAARLEDLRRVEAELLRQRQFAALGEAAAVIAHEIRNPLGIIKTSADVLRGRASLQPSDARLLDFVRDEVDRIGRLVREMLAVVTPAGLQLAPVDLSALVRDVAGFVGPSLESHAIAPVLDVADGVVVEGDADKLRQVLLNLALNAVDAMPKGGTLAFRLGQPAAGKVELEVEDSGVGIAQEVRARIFDPFFTTKARGSGLGLARVQSIVRQHGGTILCRSEPEEGARFTLTLPLEPPKAA